ncbi:hypothetical protein B4N89_00630 [Embleya scabrispora]|uniref:IclR family transcriptional regulator n=2 Tax=Embleya scabrispora TaxID=159449 RepID=A0A1T3P6J9_9ACTN|nr:hypothetical protein B4N89_00630 [Embleya scabrispora]
MYFCDAHRPDLGITEISEALGMSKAVVHRLLASLRTRGLVDLDPDTRRYRLGPGAMRLGLAYLDRLDVRVAAAPELHGLSADTGETATLSVRVGDTRVYVDQVTPHREVIMSVTLGAPYPLCVGASSKALLAFLPEARDVRALARLLADGPARAGEGRGRAAPAEPGPAVRRMTEELAEIRARGWARSSGERQAGAGSVAVPVFDHEGRPIAVISVCGPAERFSGVAEDCLAHLLRAGRRLSECMGAPPARSPTPSHR